MVAASPCSLPTVPLRALALGTPWILSREELSSGSLPRKLAMELLTLISGCRGMGGACKDFFGNSTFALFE